jgi:hypothetical protein
VEFLRNGVCACELGFVDLGIVLDDGGGGYGGGIDDSIGILREDDAIGLSRIS